MCTMGAISSPVLYKALIPNSVKVKVSKILGSTHENLRFTYMKVLTENEEIER